MRICYDSQLYERSKLGDPDALYALGALCEKRWHGKESRRLAEQLYLRAARSGHAQALFALGSLIYAYRDPYLAADIWFLAAKKGSIEAMLRLSKMFSDEGMTEIAQDYNIRAIIAEDDAAIEAVKNRKNGGFDNE